MAIKLTTTVLLPGGELEIPEFGGRTLVHPLNDYDISSEFDEDELRQSSTLQNALDNSWITMKDSNDNPLTNLDVDLQINIYDVTGGAVVHNSTFGIQGGATGEYNHISDSELTVLQNTSNTNTGDQTATTVPNTPSGNLAGTNVQSALNELQGDIDSINSANTLDVTLGANGTTQDTLDLTGQEISVNLVTPSTDGSMSASDKTKLDTIETNAKDDQIASEVVSSAFGSIGATNVQGAIEELETEINDLTASAIANVPNGNLASTDVQGAVDELQTDIDNITHNNILGLQGGTAGDYYHLTQPEHQVLTAASGPFLGTTLGGTALGLVPDDGILATGNRVLQDNGQWGNIGGAKSMILSFSSEGSPELSTSSTTYVRLAAFIYAGSDAVGGINTLRVNAWRVGGASIDVRIVDLTSALVIAELNIISDISSNLQDMGTISNIPTSATVFEVQGKKTGGGAKLNMASIEIEY